MPKVVEVPGVGNVEFPDSMDDNAIGAALAKQFAPQPSLARRALAWATTPFKAMEPVLAEQKQQADAAGPPIINRLLGVSEANEPGVLTAAKAFVSGLPGYQPTSRSSAEDAQQAKFRAEHPVAAIGLPLAAGFASPVLPGSPSKPGAVDAIANSLAARTLRGTAGEYRQLGKEGVQEIGDFLLRRGAVKLGSSPAAVAERVRTLPEATGEDLTKAIGALDATGGQVSKRDLAQRFMDLANEAKQNGPGAAPLVSKFEGEANAVLKDIEASGQPMMSFAEAEKWKRAYQDAVNYARKNNTPVQMGQREVASAARQGVEDAAAAAGSNEAFLAAKQESGLAQKAAQMAEGAEGRRTARNMVGLTARGAGIAGAIAAAHSGHLEGTLPALLAGVALEEATKRAPATLAVLLKGAAPGAARTAAQGGAADLMTILREIRANRSTAPAYAQNE